MTTFPDDLAVKRTHAVTGVQYWETFSLTEDRDRRLAWLYGDPEARKIATAADLEAWRNLGRKAAP